ncbi:MAG: DUF1552 domain-containing protein [Bryobacteraceae bacterium]
MIVTKKKLDRRSFLRGVGVTIGLPVLDAMTPALVRAATKPPVRLMFFYLPNGIDMPNWNIDYQGKLGALPRILKPMEAHREDTLILSNLTHNYGRALLDGAGDHGRCCASYLTGAHVKKTSTDIYVNGPQSMDQLIAGEIGQQTRLPSLEVGMEDPRQTGSCDSGYSCAYTNNLAWKSETQPMPPVLDPRLMFERLFGSFGDLTMAQRLQQQRLRSSVLDFVRESTQKLTKELGPSDRRKLDEYLGAIRGIEQQMDRAVKDENPVDPGMGKPAGAPSDFGDHFKLLTDMVTIAFRSDLTRVGTFMITREGTSRAYREIGISDGHHPLTHHGGKVEQLAKVTQINEYHVKNFAAWIERLKTIPEGDGRLLDNLVLVYGASLNDGNRHIHDDLPTILVGQGGGTIKTGRRMVFRKETPFCNLHLSLMDRMGVQRESFGDSSGRLPGLETA